MVEGLIALRSRVADNPDDPNERKLLVEALIEAGETAEACDEAQVLVEALPLEAWAYELAAKACDAAGNAVGARRMRKQAMGVAPPTSQPTGSHPSGANHSGLRVVGSDPLIRALPKYRLDDIVGLATVKSRIETIVSNANNTRRVRSPQGWAGGTLFYGPDGCGKRFCASVIAGELDCDAYAMPADAATAVAALRNLLNSGSADGGVIFVERIDRPAGDTLALETVLHSAATRHDSVVLGSATLPWQVSPELVRSGRLDAIVLVLPPDAPARSVYLRDRFPAMESSELAWLVTHTDGHSFEEMEALAGIVSGVPDLEELRDALRRVPPGSARWLTTAGHHALMNQSSGLYDDLISYFRARQHRP